MRAVTQTEYGTSSKIAIADVAVPEPAHGQVLIAVGAAGLDQGVRHLMTGLPYAVRLAGYGFRAPKQPIPGSDVAGRIVAVGDGVTTFTIGDDVYGIGQGTFAEFCVADADKIVHRPEHLPVVEAATAAISGSTASQALFDVGELVTGHRVLVLGASGGVGSFVTQLAAAYGADVTGVASAAKRDLVEGFGASEVLAYETDDFTACEPFNMIIDCGGLNPVRKLRSALTRHGHLVIVGGEGGGKFTGGAGRQLRAMALSPFVPQRLSAFIAVESARAWERLEDCLAAGTVRSHVGSTYPLAAAAEAVDALASGRIHGKAALVVDDELI